jgi:hypothetical protein
LSSVGACVWPASSASVACAGDVASLHPEAAPQRPLLCAALSADGGCLAASGEAVALGEDDWLGGDAAGAAAMPGARSKHQPPPKWSPIHVWQRGAMPLG